MIAASLATTATARADEGTVAILGLELTGDAAPELAPQLLRSLRGGLSTVGAKVVSLDDVQSALERHIELAGCVSTTCLRRLGELVKAQRFVRARVEATGAEYLLDIELLSPNAEDGVVRRLEKACTICTITELNELTSQAAHELLAARDEAVSVVIATTPAGAALEIDGKKVGRTPWRGSLATGSHAVVARAEGRAIVERTIEVAGGSATPREYELVLPDLARPVSGPEEPAGRFGAWKWVTAGGSLVLIAGGVTAVAIDSRKTCDDATCPEQYRTLLGGAITIAVGVGLGAVSGTMFWDDAQARNRPSLSVAPTRGGAVAGMSFQF